jgi:uncharacterized membrane protein YeaQ/YmgE (transglycosylase-associated protein family)
VPPARGHSINPRSCPLFFDGLATSTLFVRRRRHLLLAVLHTVYRRVIGMTDRRDEKRHNTWFDRGCLAIVLTALIGAVIGAALAPAVSPGDISGDLTQRFDAFFGACIGALVGLLIVVVAGLAHRFRNRNAKPS